MDIIEQVKSKIAELQNIMTHKGEGGERENPNVANSLTTSSNADNNIKTIEGGENKMNPITRDGQPVVDGKLTSPDAIAAMSGGANIPPTDFLALAKASDPYNENAAIPAVITAKDKESAPETNKEINDALKKMPSTTEHAEAEKVVEKEVSTKKASDVIADIVARVKQLKQANDEISDIVSDKPAQTDVQKSKESILAKIREKLQHKAKVDGSPTDPVKGGEDAAKTPEESVKSIKTTKAEAEMRPVEPVGDGKKRYTPDKDIRDQEAKDAESKGKKDEGVREKEPKLDRPVTHKKAGLAGKLASLEVFASDDEAARLRSKKVKYPVEKSPDMDFDGAASATESAIKKEHSERDKDKGEKSPMKSVLWSQEGRKVVAARPSFQEMTDAQKAKVEEMAKSLKSKEEAGEIDSAFAVAMSKVQDMIEDEGRVKSACDKESIKKQIQAYKDALGEIVGDTPDDIRKLEVLEANVNALESEMQKLSYIPMSTKPTTEMSWEEIISEGNAVYADLMRILGEVSNVADPFIEEAEKSVKAASLKLAKEEDGDDKEKDEDEGKDKGSDEDKEKGKGKGKGKKDESKSVAKETINLLKDIRETTEEMTEEIGEHLENVEKKTGIPVPEIKPTVSPDIAEEVAEKAPLEMGGIPGVEELPPLPEAGAPALRCGWIGIIPKTAAEEEQIVEQIKKDPALMPEQKWSEIKKLRKIQGWKAVFSKLGTAEDKVAKKEATVDKKNSYWSVYRGDELVLRATAEDLYKAKAEEAFDWVSSKGYGEKLLSAVLNDGLNVTAEKLGIQSMVKISAKEKVDPKAYYKKIYPASYVSELFKEHKKKADAEIGQLKAKIGELEQSNVELKKANDQLIENQALHAKAEKALNVVKLAVDKGLVDQKEFDSVVDGVMLMNDNGFDTFSKTIMKAPSVKTSSIDEKIEMVKSASKNSSSVNLDVPIQIPAVNSSPMDALKTQLSQVWKVPGKN